MNSEDKVIEVFYHHSRYWIGLNGEVFEQVWEDGNWGGRKITDKVPKEVVAEVISEYNKLKELR